jgi:uncharacterized integral membrane protein
VSFGFQILGNYGAAAFRSAGFRQGLSAGSNRDAIRPGRYDYATDNPSGQEERLKHQPDPGERQTRLSGAWAAVVVAVVALVVILVFILQNPQSAELYFLTFHGHLPLAVALLFAMVLGAIVVLALGGGRILQLRMVARRMRHQRVRASPPAE